MSNILVRTVVVALLLAIVAFGTGAVFGHEWGWWLLSLAYLALLLRHVRNLQLLSRWASRSLADSVPEGTGAWQEVFTLLYRRQRAEIAERRKLAR
jgi:two-component system phosphate regulon sensor histidine kinase PhoR